MTPETSLQNFSETWNKSSNMTDISLTLHLTMTLTCQVICLLGLVGNGFVIWFLCCRMERNSISVYILNLAIVDFFLLLCLFTGLLYELSKASGIILTTTLYSLGFTLEALFSFCYDTSLFLLTAISMERCSSAVFPIWYKCRRTRHLSIFVCSLLWMLALIDTILEIFLCPPEQAETRAPSCAAVMWTLVITSFGIVTPLMILSSLILICHIQRTSIARQPKRLYRAILLNVLFFVICTFPTRLIFVLRYFQVIELNESYTAFHVYTHYFLTSVNSCANPFIYFLVGRSKKRESGGFILGALFRLFSSETEAPSQDKVSVPCESGIKDPEYSGS